MPLTLDQNDAKIIKSLMEDGRKSFRQISRETGITTPTVKARYERLVNVGFIEGVLPIFNFDKVELGEKNLIQIQDIRENIKEKKGLKQNIDNKTLKIAIDKIEKKITSGLAINIECDFCNGPVYVKPKVLKFANIERFFCCTSCRANYSEKYRGRIESIKRRYECKSDIEV